MMTLEEQKTQLSKIRAFDGVSFDPEKRMASFIREYDAVASEIIANAQKYGLTPDQVARLIDKHYKLATEYLCSESRCLSWAITGPANFPVARNEKRLNTCQDRLNRYVEFSNNIEKLCKRITRKAETEDDKKARWLDEIEKLKRRHEMMKDVNAMIRKGQKDEAEKKYVITLEKNCWGEYGFMPFHLSNNLANIHRLEQQVSDIDRIREQKVGAGFDFDGGSVAFDADEIRWNISFDAIPEADMRTKLKSHGFKWSPRRQAWTRGAKTMSLKTIREIMGV